MLWVGVSGWVAFFFVFVGFMIDIFVLLVLIVDDLLCMDMCVTIISMSLDFIDCGLF